MSFDQSLTVANSILLGPSAIQVDGDPAGRVYLLHNDFAWDPTWLNWPEGEGNFSADPWFVFPFPPDGYFIDPWSPCADVGADVGLPFHGSAPDVGAFEVGFPNTARPPTNPAVEWSAGNPIRLTWTLSADDPYGGRPGPSPVLDYWIYRSESPGPVPVEWPHAYVPAGVGEYPDFGYVEAITYYYQVRAHTGPGLDGLPLLSAPTEVVSILPSNQQPAAANDAYSVDEDQILSVAAPGVLGNDDDPDGDALTAGLVSGPAHGSLNLTPDGSFTYRPAPDFFGSGAFTYAASDGSLASAPATVTIAVNAVPEVLRVASITVATSTERNNTQATATILVVTPAGAPVAGAFVSGHWTGLTSDTDSGPTGASGTVSFASDPVRKATGTYTFVIDRVATPDYVLDTNGGVLSASIVYPPPAANQPPSAADDTATAGPATPITVAVLLNDSDPDGDPLTLASVTQPANGSASANSDGTVTYTPNPGFLGVDGFHYTVSDGRGGTATASVTVTVSGAPPASSMHVADISMSLDLKKVTKATALVTVVDDAGQPVSGAAVSGLWSGAVSGTASGLTGTDGSVALASPGIKDASGQTFTFTVADISKLDWSYDAGANAETTDSITAP